MCNYLSWMLKVLILFPFLSDSEADCGSHYNQREACFSWEALWRGVQEFWFSSRGCFNMVERIKANQKNGKKCKIHTLFAIYFHAAASTNWEGSSTSQSVRHFFSSIHSIVWNSSSSFQFFIRRFPFYLHISNAKCNAHILNVCMNYIWCNDIRLFSWWFEWKESDDVYSVFCWR